MDRIVYKYIADDHSLYLKRIGFDKTFQKIDGEFYVAKANELFYKVSMPNAWKKEFSVPNKIKCQGKWELSKDSELVFTVSKSDLWARSQKIVFKSSYIESNAKTIVFSVRLKDDGEVKQGLAKLSGSWRVDTKNQLSFLLSKSLNADKLKFNGHWRLAKNKLTYVLDKKHTLQWDGIWQLDQLKRLRYKIKGTSDSYFEFKVSVESNSLRAKDNVIKFRIGASADTKSIFQFFGVWKISKRYGLEFVLKDTETKQGFRFKVSRILSENANVILVLSLMDKPWLKLSINKKFLDSDANFKLNFKKMINSWSLETRVDILF